MKSKKWAIVRGCILVAVCAFVVYVAFCWPYHILTKILCISLVAITAFAHLCAMYCPHCGAIGKLPCHLFSKTCGRCRECKKLVYWKECVEVDI